MITRCSSIIDYRITSILSPKNIFSLLQFYGASTIMNIQDILRTCTKTTHRHTRTIGNCRHSTKLLRVQLSIDWSEEDRVILEVVPTKTSSLRRITENSTRGFQRRFDTRMLNKTVIDGNVVDVVGSIIPLNEFPQFSRQWINGSYSCQLFGKCGRPCSPLYILMKNSLKYRKKNIQRFEILYNSMEGVLQAFELMDAMEVLWRDVVHFSTSTHFFELGDVVGFDTKILRKCQWPQVFIISRCGFCLIWPEKEKTGLSKQPIWSQWLQFGVPTTKYAPSQNLTSLYLNDNALTYIPFICDHTNLNLNSNQLQELEQLSSCPLTELYLDDNAFEEFSQCGVQNIFSTHSPYKISLVQSPHCF